MHRCARHCYSFSNARGEAKQLELIGMTSVAEMDSTLVDSYITMTVAASAGSADTELLEMEE